MTAPSERESLATVTAADALFHFQIVFSLYPLIEQAFNEIRFSFVLFLRVFGLSGIDTTDAQLNRFPSLSLFLPIPTQYSTRLHEARIAVAVMHTETHTRAGLQQSAEKKSGTETVATSVLWELFLSHIILILQICNLNVKMKMKKIRKWREYVWQALNAIESTIFRTCKVLILAFLRDAMCVRVALAVGHGIGGGCGIDEAAARAPFSILSMICTLKPFSAQLICTTNDYIG